MNNFLDAMLAKIVSTNDDQRSVGTTEQAQV
jgi:hypothetical protein